MLYKLIVHLIIVSSKIIAKTIRRYDLQKVFFSQQIYCSTVTSQELELRTNKLAVEIPYVRYIQELLSYLIVNYFEDHELQ
jgi:hypothetical protein